MRKLPLILVLLTLSMSAFAAKRITSYGDMMKALRNGDNVKVVVDYLKTKLVIDGKEEPSVDATGGTQILHWERFAKGLIGNKEEYVAFSETVLIAHPRHKHVYNYVRFRIYESGKVEITARYLKTDTMEIVMDETFTGQISNGKDQHGVNLFVGK